MKFKKIRKLKVLYIPCPVCGARNEHGAIQCSNCATLLKTEETTPLKSREEMEEIKEESTTSKSEQENEDVLKDEEKQGEIQTTSLPKSPETQPPFPASSSPIITSSLSSPTDAGRTLSGTTPPYPESSTPLTPTVLPEKKEMIVKGSDKDEGEKGEKEEEEEEEEDKEEVTDEEEEVGEAVENGEVVEEVVDSADSAFKSIKTSYSKVADSIKSGKAGESRTLTEEYRAIAERIKDEVAVAVQEEVLTRIRGIIVEEISKKAGKVGIEPETIDKKLAELKEVISKEEAAKLHTFGSALRAVVEQTISKAREDIKKDLNTQVAGMIPSTIDSVVNKKMEEIKLAADVKASPVSLDEKAKAEIESIKASVSSIPNIIENKLNDAMLKQSLKMGEEISRSKADAAALAIALRELKSDEGWKKRTEEMLFALDNKIAKLQSESMQNFTAVVGNIKQDVDELKSEIKRLEEKSTAAVRSKAEMELLQERAKAEELKKQYEAEIKEIEAKLKAEFENKLTQEISRRDESAEVVKLKIITEAKQREEDLKKELNTLKEELESRAKEIAGKLLEEEKEKVKARIKEEIEEVYATREKKVLEEAEEKIRRMEGETRAAIKKEACSRLKTLLKRESVEGDIVEKYNIFPFTAIVGQDRMKRALLLNAINPAIGGVVLWGNVGSGKTTSILSLNALLNRMNDPDFSVDLDYLEKRYLWGEAIRFPFRYTFFLDTLSNSVALSLPTIAHAQPTEPLIIKDDDDLDRTLIKYFSRIFLHVEVKPLQSIDQRIEVLRRVNDYIKNPEGFIKRFENDEKKLETRLKKAKQILPNVIVSTQMLENIAKICLFNNHPPETDIYIAEIAKANAAYEERDKVILDDVKEAADMFFSDGFDKVFSIEDISTEKKLTLKPLRGV